MKFHFFYGRSPKLSQQDKDAFSGNGYKCELLLQNKKGQHQIRRYTDHCKS